MLTEYLRAESFLWLKNSRPRRLICIGKTPVIGNSVAFTPRGSSVMEFGSLIETQMAVSDLSRSFTAYYAWEWVS